MEQTAHLTEDELASSSHAASMAPIKDGQAVIDDSPEIDDQGTDQDEAAQLLRKLRDNAFEGSDEKLALALGRPIEEIRSWLAGDETIDGDVLLKAKAMATERGASVE